MLHDTTLAIQADLSRVEQQETLGDEGNFVARIQALDVLVLRVLERIENVQYVYGYREELARLYHRAEQLWQRWQAVNTQLFHRLRAQLLAAASPGAALRQMCATYVGAAEPASTALDTDYLDVFLNGILGIDGTPEETKTLLPEMIGYYPTPARVVLAFLDHTLLSTDDVFYDLGSGLGRVVLLVGLLTTAQARGIEFEPAYCAYAQQRAHALHLSRVTFVNGNVRTVDYADGTTFFLYTPFTGRLFQDVLTRLRQVACAHPITIAAYGACTREVARQPWLQPTVQQVFGPDTLAVFASQQKA
jgi:hypothetical protein